MQDKTVARLQSNLSPLKYCNVLRESLSEGSQNIPCATLKRRGSWVISLYIYDADYLLFETVTISVSEPD
jgi:hypothetical protein